MKKIKAAIAVLLSMLMLTALCACVKERKATGGMTSSGSSASVPEASSESSKSVQGGSSLNENYFQSSVML